MLLALTTNDTVGWKWVAETTALAYNTYNTIVAMKSLNGACLFTKKHFHQNTILLNHFG